MWINRISCLLVCAGLGLALPGKAQVGLSLAIEHPPFPKPGGKATARLTVEIEQGWHIMSLTQPEGGPVRTTIVLGDKQPFKLSGPIDSPKPHVEHSEAFDMDVETYNGTVVFTLPLIATEDLKPGTKLTVEITYQACTEETCLLPKTDRVVTVLGPKPSGKGK